jgi:hypothetical protein
MLLGYWLLTFNPFFGSPGWRGIAARRFQPAGAKNQMLVASLPTPKVVVEDWSLTAIPRQPILGGDGKGKEERGRGRKDGCCLGIEFTNRVAESTIQAFLFLYSWKELE